MGRFDANESKPEQTPPEGASRLHRHDTGLGSAKLSEVHRSNQTTEDPNLPHVPITGERVIHRTSANYQDRHDGKTQPAVVTEKGHPDEKNSGKPTPAEEQKIAEEKEHIRKWAHLGKNASDKEIYHALMKAIVNDPEAREALLERMADYAITHDLKLKPDTPDGQKLKEAIYHLFVHPNGHN